MKYEWDENKRQTNLEKHGKSFDFANAHKLWESGAPYFDEYAERKGEERWKTTGKIDKELCVIVYERKAEDCYRLVSFRQANDDERRGYEQELVRDTGREHPIFKTLEYTKEERENRQQREPDREIRPKKRDDYER
jgi:uncharacterized DUF497 family protein